MGRLDYDSEGLILMTDDGELSQHVMHPKYEVEKTYIATVEGKLSGGVCRRLVHTGVNLDDGWVKLDKCTILDQNRDYTMVRVVLHSGKNRIISITQTPWTMNAPHSLSTAPLLNFIHLYNQCLSKMASSKLCKIMYRYVHFQTPLIGSDSENSSTIF